MTCCVLLVSLMQLVYEKEKRLRMMMKMHGLGDAAYWMVMYAWFLLLYVAYMAVLVGFAGAVDMHIFSKNDYGGYNTQRLSCTYMPRQLLHLHSDQLHVVPRSF